MSKPYRMSAPHKRIRSVIASYGRTPIDYDSLSERAGVGRKSVPVFVCHLRRNGLIRRVGRCGELRFEVVTP
jgi:predicted Rossmann fold nucleotide-binding protein DprA/Smf involved in DNA uptake